VRGLRVLSKLAAHPTTVDACRAVRAWRAGHHTALRQAQSQCVTAAAQWAAAAVQRMGGFQRVARALDLGYLHAADERAEAPASVGLAGGALEPGAAPRAVHAAGMPDRPAELPPLAAAARSPDGRAGPPLAARRHAAEASAAAARPPAADAAGRDAARPGAAHPGLHDASPHSSAGAATSARLPARAAADRAGTSPVCPEPAPLMVVTAAKVAQCAGLRPGTPGARMPTRAQLESLGSWSHTTLRFGPLYDGLAWRASAHVWCLACCLLCANSES
jgi:hypothetical protein